MRRWWRVGLLFLVVYLLALLATLPAAQALRWAEPALAKLPQRPTLLGVEGSLWSGHAAQLLYRGTALGELHWDISVWRLVVGRLDTRLALARDDGHLDARLVWPLGGSEWQLQQVEGQLPASLLKELLPQLVAAPGGTIGGVVKEAGFAAAQLRTLDGRLVWNRAGLTSPFALEFGDLVAQFETRPEGVVGTIRDAGGPLQLEAQLNLAADRSYTLSGKALARSGANPALATSLSLLGQPDGQGRMPFRFVGRW